MKDNKFTPSDKGANQNKLPKNSNTRKTPKPCTNKAIKIDADMEHEILKRLPNPNTQYYTVTKAVIKHGELLTGKANPLGGVNISNVANKLVNPHIKDLGIELDCRRPEKKIINQHGNQSGQMYWGFHKL